MESTFNFVSIPSSVIQSLFLIFFFFLGQTKNQKIVSIQNWRKRKCAYVQWWKWNVNGIATGKIFCHLLVQFHPPRKNRIFILFRLPWFFFSLVIYFTDIHLTNSYVCCHFTVKSQIYFNKMYILSLIACKRQANKQELIRVDHMGMWQNASKLKKFQEMRTKQKLQFVKEAQIHVDIRVQSH